MMQEYGVRDMQKVQVIDGALYALLAPKDTNSYSGDDMRVTRFDLTTGEAVELELEGEYSISPYKDGKLLAYSPYGRESRGVQVFDPVTGQLGEELIPFNDLDDEAAVGISYSGGGITYDAASDTIYFVDSGLIMAYKDGVLSEVAFIPVDYASNIRSAQVVGDRYLCTSWDGVYLRSLRPEDQPERSLRISGGYADDITRAFTESTGIPVVFSSAWYAGAEAVRNDMISGSRDSDIYVVGMQNGARALMEKGYLQDLSASGKLMEDVGRMYPQLQEAMMLDGKLYGYPYGFNMNLWSINPKLWEQFELGDVPETFLGYVELIERWNDELAEDNPDYTVTNLYNGKQELISQALSHYLYQYEQPDAPISFNTPAFRETMQAIEALDMEPIDWENMTQEDREEIWEQMDRPALFDMNAYRTVERSFEYYSTPDGGFEPMETKTILRCV